MAKREQLIVNQIMNKDGKVIEPANSGTSGSLTKLLSGTTVLSKARAVDSIVMIQLVVDTTFAAGDGAAPSFVIGQTGTTNKFLASKSTGTAGDLVTVSGVLTAGAQLIVTQVAATGTTSAGAVTVNAIVV